MAVIRSRTSGWVGALTAWLGLLAIDAALLVWLAPHVSSGTYRLTMIVVGLAILGSLITLDHDLLRLLHVHAWQYLCFGIAILVGVGKLVAVNHVPAGRVPLVVLFFLLAVACTEEMAVRGFMWNRLAEVLPNRWAVLGVDSALFLFLHAPSWVIVDGDPITISAQAVIGLALGLIRMASRGLVMPVTVHFLVDVFGV